MILTLLYIKGLLMNFKKWIWLPLSMYTSLSFCGCAFMSEKKEMRVRDYLKIKATRKNEREVEALLQELVSPDFFEHTQASRALILKGSRAVPFLYKCRELKRHVNGCSIPVCLVVLRRIFSLEKKEWLKKQLDNPWAKISKLAEKELNKRKSQKK